MKNILSKKNKIHLAVAVSDVAKSAKEYSKLLGRKPSRVVAGQYALWRYGNLNLSIRHDPKKAGSVRHVGFEAPRARSFKTYRDRGGLVWEFFDKKLQENEIKRAWPDA